MKIMVQMNLGGSGLQEFATGFGYLLLENGYLFSVLQNTPIRSRICSICISTKFHKLHREEFTVYRCLEKSPVDKL